MATQQASQNGLLFNQRILDKLPHWAMLIEVNTCTILAANQLARQGGAKLSGQCWEDFVSRMALPLEQREAITQSREPKRENHRACQFCAAGEAAEEGIPIRKEVEVAGRIYDTHWVPVRDQVYLHYAFDITDLRLAETSRLEAASLKAAIETAGAVCHEMNQPLQALTIGLEMIDLKKPEIGPELNKVLDQAWRMRGIISKLLNITEYRTRDYVNGKHILALD